MYVEVRKVEGLRRRRPKMSPSLGSLLFNPLLPTFPFYFSRGRAHPKIINNFQLYILNIFR
jgi:hypothetical protein